MDKAQRGVLRSVVVQCRTILEESLRYVLEGDFGVDQEGHLEDESMLPHLDVDDLAARRVVVDHLSHFQAAGATPAQAVERAVREAAFTHLNRLCAYKMLERRKVIRETVSRGTDSDGFKFYLADRPKEELLWTSGKQDLAYRHFLTWRAESLSDQISVLFSPNEIANYLLPQHSAIESVLELINQSELEEIWDEDETIGWTYQYFTPDEVRRQARQESSAPRDSHELAFRNQFYTPRYVVEFLVENTLGKLWYDMMHGETSLVDSCCYLVYFPGQWQEMPKKDPREIRIMDPACGSGHFLLYCFDLMLCIYQEAYTDPELGPVLAREFPTLESLRMAAPGLIIEKNLCGIDIDPRATQITALALWLRAQRAYAEARVPVAERPTITKANIICAEPMPGQADMLEEFLRDLKPAPLRPLVREVFQRMELAGEAGSLLKIEEEIHDVVEEARERWGRSPREHQLSLFASERRDEPSEQLELGLLAMTTDEFWAEAEANIVESLKIYAEQNGQCDNPFARRLFSEDAGRGFAFVDACRKQYDVVLMNPPFGQPSTPSKDYITRSYPISKHDVACAFVERWLGKCTQAGRLGAITTRTPFFLLSSTAWREEVVLKDGRLRAFADMGFGVLDAMVETAACVLDVRGSDDPALFVRALEEKVEEKGLAISQALSNHDDPRCFTVRPASLEQVPNSPLCYWVSDRVRALFRELHSFEGEGRTAKVGLQTGDDFRFVRLWTEVAPEKIGSKWFPFAKGGAYSPYYADLHLVVNWENDGEKMRAYSRSAIRNPGFYFRPGLTWSRRTTSDISVRVLPRGCVFADKGPAVFAQSDEELLPLAGFLNSQTAKELISLMLGAADAAARSYEVGIVQKIPLVCLDGVSDRIAREVGSYISIARQIEVDDEVSHAFFGPYVHASHMSLNSAWNSVCAKHEEIRQSLSQSQTRIDLAVRDAYGAEINENGPAIGESGHDGNDGADESTSGENSGEVGLSEAAFTAGTLSWCLGVAFGRWDVGFATGEKSIQPLPDDPFAPLHEYSPGMLRDRAILEGEVGFPEYPVAISVDGILVDDPESPDDIVRKVSEVFEAIWGERADEVESEACDILGVDNLREYFRNPRHFFDYHIKQYSMSRRKAPIYWLLQSPKRSYGLWIYYHRLNKDTLFRALAMYVEPKIRLEQSRLDQMRAERARAGTGGSEVKRLERAIDQHEDLLSDLHAFRDRLSRAAGLYLDPDLDDGVILNMAPLWELVPWKEPKGHWEKLLRGEYEWSSIAKQLAKRG